jgi:hypothetical protein
MYAFSNVLLSGKNFTPQLEDIRFITLTCLSTIAMVVRVREPFVWNTFQRLFRCKKRKTSRLHYSSLSLNSFINSAMNVEFVCLMITGVRNCLVDSNNSDVHDLHGIQLEDLDSWNIRPLSNDFS